LPYYIRQMYKEDTDQIMAIDREAFPTQWPPPNYQRELQNRLSHYIVACDEDRPIERPEMEDIPKNGFVKSVPIWGRLFRRRNSSSNDLSPSRRHYIVGFSGFWIMADEAHISSIAVRESYRQQGIGELLLISIIGMAMELKARIITLEVRASNTTAQNLYTKYGFTQVGVRRGYYIDDREDGIIMTTESINSDAFQTNFQQLKRVLSKRLGIERYQIVR